jgi:hypothetical protein
LSIGFCSGYYKLHFHIGLPSELSLPKQGFDQNDEIISPAFAWVPGRHSKSQNKKISEVVLGIVRMSANSK